MKHTHLKPIKSSMPLRFNQEWIDGLFSEVDVVWVGFSGGVDSHVLLHAIVSQLTAQQRRKLAVIHIHHGLSDHADSWLSHCEQVCQKLDVRFVAKRVQLEAQASVEDAARNARYQAFEQIMTSKEVLLLAHHGDDQAETVLFRLLRGTGGKGLSGMPRMRAIGVEGAYLVRPLLDISKVSIESYARQEKLKWIQDDSNADERFTRNFLRQRVVPILKERFPKMEQNIASGAKRIETDYLMLSRFAERQLAKWCNEYGGLDLSFLSEESLEERLFWLRHFLQNKSISLPQLQLENVEQMLSGREDRHPEFKLKNGRIMRHQNFIYFLPLDQEVTLAPLNKDEILKRSFDEVLVSGCNGCVLGERPEGAVLSFENGNSRKLKKWLNDLQVPSWWRNHLPYIFIDTELVAIGSLWRHPDYPHVKVEWRLSGELPLLVSLE
ncbi:tRNA(Ile)-lysidine synthetase [Marinomonas ushuaiensis DSM 15871]|uniref:tRNA(Ile)-lysidine synthase n=2 Tax=Marinomonas TaxID=28253 RepID=X7E6D2_9GAMM|nr:tRNA(Ile)-lysidine synthetase [Marinomonas ushuaiensis DSM 15871]